ncbi:MAG: hypothetical protein K0S75_2957 [Clostridia bacterium]|nr:hypothetical protein [Clostridia bacterium]
MDNYHSYRYFTTSMEEFPIPIFHFFVHTKISCEKDLSNTKSVEASDFILSKMCFSQLINRGKQNQ